MIVKKTGTYILKCKACNKKYEVNMVKNNIPCIYCESCRRKH